MVSETAHNFLTEPMISVRYRDGESAQLTLPGVLHRLATAEIDAFCALRRHQRQSWFCFLVQLGAIALHRAELTVADAGAAGEADWRDWLRALTNRSVEPWCLVVADLSKPAFFQPPVAELTLAGWNLEVCADALDILITSKDHDVKSETTFYPSPEQWLFSLVSVQTTGGYEGRSINGIVRMNGGFASRALVAHAPGQDFSPRWRRDAAQLLTHRHEIADAESLAGSHALLWLPSWDGNDSLALGELDPLFIECCRRIRCTVHLGTVVASRTGTTAQRVAAKERSGCVGDPWLPIGVKERKALTISEQGFSYAKVVELLFSGDYSLGWASKAQLGDAGLLCQVLARGQGQTAGLQERWVLLPEKVRRSFRAIAGDPLAERAQDWVKWAAIGRTKVLRPALLLLQQSGTDKLKADAKTADAWTQRFDAMVDSSFFEQLWTCVDLSTEAAQRHWGAWLFDAATDLLNQAIDATPFSGPRKYRAIAAAEGLLRGAAYKNGLLIKVDAEQNSATSKASA